MNIAIDKTEHLTQIVQSAKELTEAGFAVVRANGKAMKDPNWQKLQLKEWELEGYFEDGDNIAFRNGHTSGGSFVTVDIDCEDAHAFKHYLPPTDMVAGRSGNPESHLTYRVEKESDLKTRRFKGVEGDSIIELLGEGTAVVCPPSIHPTGESYKHYGFLDPFDVPYEAVLHAVQKAVIACHAARSYPQHGSRNDYCLALSGLLLKCGMDTEEVCELIGDVAAYCGDEECDSRRKTAEATAIKFKQGDPVLGASVLEGMVGEGTIKRIIELVPGKASYRFDLKKNKPMRSLDS